MASKRKKTLVTKDVLGFIPSVPLRILSFLVSRQAFTREAAVKVSTIASELELGSDDVRFDCRALCAPGFAVLEVHPICDVDRKATRVYIATDPKIMNHHAQDLRRDAEQIQGRGDYMARCAKAVAIGCQPWSDLAAPGVCEE